MLQPIDFDPSVSWWELRIRKLPGNQATAINTIYRDSDSTDNSDQEECQFSFDISSVPDDSQFHIITVPTDAFDSFQTSTGTPNGINDPGLDQIQIQSVSGSDARTHVEVDYARVYTVPEPASILLMLTAVMGMPRCRR